MHPPAIAVIIPFFQREAGLLKQCVQSILDQETDDVGIIVVDDSSPVPAKEELAKLLSPPEERIRIIHQPNAGPGAARNRGLAQVPEGTPYVAFLDSDDHWTGPFLADAAFALGLGYDLFIGNSTRVGIETTRFEWDADPRLNIRSEDHRLIDADREIYEYQGDFFDLLVHRSSIISTTTMAYRFDRFPSARFEPTLFNGQDRLFKLTLGQHVRRVAFSPRIYAYEGEGVNIFDKARWGTPGSIRLMSSYIRLSKCILDRISLTPDQRAHVERHLARTRRAFIESVVHLLRLRVPFDWGQVLGTLREDPVTAALLVPHTIRIGLSRFAARTDQR